MIDVAGVWRWWQQITNLTSGMTAVAWVAAFIVAGVVVAVAVRYARRVGLINLAVAAAVSVGVGASIEGMYALAVGPLHLRGVWVVVPAVLFESAAVATGARAQRHAATEGHAGRYGATVWMFAAAAGVVTALNGHSPAECAFRLIAPLVGAAVWYQGLTGGGARRLMVTWKLTPRRVAIRLGLLEPGDTDVVQVHREHRVNALTASAHRLHRAGRLRWYHAARLRRLALAADDAMVAEAQSRVARVHRIEALTAPVPADTATVTTPDAGAAIPADTSPDMATDTGADMSADTERSRGRTPSRSPRPVATATKVAKLVAKLPDADAATVAAKLAISERTARRHLSAMTAATPAQRINGHRPVDSNITNPEETSS